MYDEHGAALTAYVQRLVHGDRQQAEDIIQETCSGRGGTPMGFPSGRWRPWLFVTARNLVDRRRPARRSRPVEVGPELIDVAGQDDGLDAALDAVLLTDALRALSVEHRQVLFDAYYRGRTATEIAAARGLPAGTVRSRLHYALRALRLALQERGVNSMTCSMSPRLGGYVLHALETAEEYTVGATPGRCDECLEEVAGLARTASLLALVRPEDAEMLDGPDPAAAAAGTFCADDGAGPEAPQ